MAARRILLLDANRLIAFRWQSNGPIEEGRFTADEAGHAGFGDYLQQNRSSLFYLLTDIAEEGFQVEELPHVQGGDRRELIKRKLSQFYYGTPFSMAVSLGRSKEGRRDERVLFAGLTGHAQIEGWLEAMRLTETQLVGVFSLAQVVARLFGRLARTTDWALLITIGSAGLRQTFFDNGQLRFSRLSPMAVGNPGDVASACAAEAKKIYQYLASQRLIARDQPLKTLVLAHPDQFSVFADRCRDTPERRFEFLDLASISGKHGLKAKPPDSNADLLFAQLLMTQQPRQQFAPEPDLRPFRLWQARVGIQTAAAGLLAASLLLAGTQAFSLNNLTSANSETRTNIELNQRRYDAMLQGLPKIPISMDELRALTDRYRLLLKRSPGPESSLQHISRALTKAPSIDLWKLEWHLGNSPDDDSLAGVRQVPATRIDGTGSYAIVDLQARLPAAMASDHRSQLETVNAFVAALSTADVQVKVVSLPFETESGKSIRSGETGAEAEPPKLVLRMVQKL